MQGLWSTHRRSKLNLNSMPTGSPPESPKGDVTPPVSDTNPVENSNARNGNDQVNGHTQGSSSENRPSSAGVKRKLRTYRSSNTGETTKKHKSSAVSSKDFSAPSTRLSDLGGVEACVEKMLELIAMPLCHPEVYLHTGVQPPRGVLLHGPPGCGKTLLANAIAGVCA